jgi:FRG domain
MRSWQPPFRGIEGATAELGYPKTIWFRGHVEEHRLLPSLFRFPHGVENEGRIVERYRYHTFGSSAETSDHSLQVLIKMHHSYVPTRLLAWTERLHVALFCALVRESDKPTVFVLDPVALNAHSNLTGSVQLNSHTGAGGQFLGWPHESSLPEHPIAIDGRSHERGMPVIETIFTLHGRNRLPLEEQCSDCVRKVVLTEEEKALAKECVLAGRWML